MTQTVSTYVSEAVEAQAAAGTQYQSAAAAAKAAIRQTEAAAGFDVAVPEAVRSLAEKAVTQSREAYDAAKGVVEEAVGTMEKSLDKAGQGAAAINRKAIDIAQANLNSGFDLAKDLAGARNLAEIVELQAAYARKQFQALVAQAEEFRALSAQVATASSEPFKAHVTRSMELMKRAS
jgi:phasin